MGKGYIIIIFCCHFVALSFCLFVCLFVCFFFRGGGGAGGRGSMGKILIAKAREVKKLIVNQ